MDNLIAVLAEFGAEGVSRGQLDAQTDLVADALIDMEDGRLMDSTVTVDFATKRVQIGLTIAGGTVEEAERLGGQYMERAFGAIPNAVLEGTPSLLTDKLSLRREAQLLPA